MTVGGAVPPQAGDIGDVAVEKQQDSRRSNGEGGKLASPDARTGARRGQNVAPEWSDERHAAATAGTRCSRPTMARSGARRVPQA